MGRIFDLDGPVIQFLNRVADLMWLNVLTMVCCLPIITAGAALTSAHYVALKLVRGEEGYIHKEFFKAFRMNFKQATLEWLVILLMIVVFAADFYIMKNTEIALPSFFQVIILAVCFLFVFMITWIFPMQAKFINTLINTVKNAFAMSIIQIPRTLLMIIMYALPYVLTYFTLRLFPVILVFGISLPVYGSAHLYNKVFQKLEHNILERMKEEGTLPADEEQEQDEEKIFSDELIISDGGETK